MTILSAEVRKWLEAPAHPYDPLLCHMHTGHIVAAAVLFDGMIISKPRPARHHDIIHSLYDCTKVRIAPEAQGFLTSKGLFVDRADALKIAKKAAQPLIDHPSRNDRYLFSEDLW